MDLKDPSLNNNNDLPVDKKSWRQHFKGKLDISSEIKKESSQKIVSNLKLLLSKVKGPIAVFAALESEPDLKALVEDLDLDWCFPKVQGDILRFYRSSWSDLKTGEFGILEPIENEKYEALVSELEWCLIPALAFDRRGVRLGRGKGYYDRSLINFKGTLVGVGFSQSISNEQLPKQNHDINMHWIVTDRYLLKTSNSVE